MSGPIDFSSFKGNAELKEKSSGPIDFSNFKGEPPKPSLGQILAQYIDIPGRAGTAAGVFAQKQGLADFLTPKRLAAKVLNEDQETMANIERGKEAFGVGFQPQSGEKIGAFAGRMVGEAPLYAAIASFMPPAAVAKIGQAGAMAYEGAVTGGIANIIKQKSETDEIKKGELALNVAGGAVLGGAAGKVSSVLANRVTVARARALAGEIEHLEEIKGRIDFLATPQPGEMASQELANAQAMSKNLIKQINDKKAELQGLAPQPPRTRGAAVHKELPPEPPPQSYIAKEERVLPGDIDPVPVMKKALKSVEALTDEFISKAPQLAVDHPEKVLAYRRGQQITDTLIEFIEEGKISPEKGAEMFGIEFTPGEAKQIILERLRATSTTSGKVLNRLSQAAKAFTNLAGEDPEIAAELARLSKDEQNITWLGNLMRKTGLPGFTTDMVNSYRGFLTSQIGTTLRNVITQSPAMRYGVGMLDDAINGTGRVLLGLESPKKAYSNVIEDGLAIFRKFSPKHRAELRAILDSVPLEKAALESNPMSDLAMTARSNLGKIPIATARALNVFNTLQEGFFRDMLFDARIRSNLTRLGLSTKEWARLPARVKGDIAYDAAMHALESTYALTPERGTGMRAVLDAYDKMPLLHLMGPTFPRFWYNAIRSLKEFGPWSLLFSKTNHQNPEIALRGISRAFTGSLMLTAAMAMRSGKFAGEKFYEIKPDPEEKPNRVADARNFNPFTTYLFIADMWKRMSEIQEGKRDTLGYSAQDVVNATIALRRADFSGIPILDDVFFNKTELTENPQRMMDVVKQRIGQIIGGFGTPLKSFRDLTEGFEASQAIKDTRQSPLLGPFVETIPKFIPGDFRNKFLEDANSNTRPGPVLRQEVGKKQIPGVSFKTKTDVEKELDRLDINASDFRSKSQDAKFDNVVHGVMGEIVNDVVGEIIKGHDYKNEKPEFQRWLVKNVLKRILSKSTKAAKKIEPGIAAEFKITEKSRKLWSSAARELLKEAQDMAAERKKDQLP